MAELVGAVASPLLECAKLVFGPIYRNIKSFFKLQSNLRSLRSKKTILKEMEDGMKQELEAAEKDGKSATPQVKEWLRQVGEVLVVSEKIELAMTADDRRPGCFLRCGICRKVRKTLREVERLVMSACPAERVVVAHRTPPSVEHIPTPSIEDQTTASKNLNQVMDFLSQDEIRSVGIWGMGGVGKTTLVKNFNNKLKSDGTIDLGMVIWATVSKDFNIKMVQTQIADRLGLTVGERDEGRMAIKLHERLTREDKFLLILDDVWEAIDLDRLGIPKPQVHKGVKMLITSRSQRVCENMTDEQVEVNVLNGKEAWKLFGETVGRVVDLEGIKPIAEQVCQQCCGLPLAIVIVGAAMKGKDMIPLWNDALSELRRSLPSIENIEEKVFKPLKWSYDKLQGNNIKSCFLYCCLYPEDYSIEVNELVKCWVGEGLIDEELNYEESRNRGLALIQNLKDACLLETGDSFGITDETVKMHDVVRDVAIWISSHDLEVGGRFLVRAGIGLYQLSQVNLSGDVKRISFMDNHIHTLPCHDACFTGCSNASTLFLQGNRSLVEVPDEFLRCFPAIKVLNLSHTDIISLPPSIMQLTNLRTLLLRDCEELRELPTTGWEGLRRMQVLDLSNTAIKELSRGMARLIKLRALNLFCTRSLESIPAGVFSTLSSLESLNMEKSSYIWRTKGDLEDRAAYLEELEGLDTLRELFIRLKPESSLSWIVNRTWIERLTRFQFRIGVTSESAFRFSLKKEIIMEDINVAEEERTGYLLSNTNATTLVFNSCRDFDKLVQSMRLNTSSCFSSLKSLSIKNTNMTLRDTSGGGDGVKYNLLPNLVYLSLGGIEGMKSISELAGHLGFTVSKLQHLRMYECNEMKYVLSVDHHLILDSLEFMEIIDCEGLEGVFEYPQGYSVGVVPNLKQIYLSRLHELRTLCKSSKAETWPSVQVITVMHCDKLRKLPVSGQSSSIEEIIGEESWWNNLEWDDPNTKITLQPLFVPFG